MYAGLDVGSSHTKLCYCGSGIARAMVWPTDLVVQRRIFSDPAFGTRWPLSHLATAVEIAVGGTPYVVTTVPDFTVRDVTLSLFNGANPQEFCAIVIAALARVPSCQIDAVALGVPFLPYLNAETRALEAQLVGVHNLGDRALQIGQVQVVPQGLGTFFATKNSAKQSPSRYDTTLVVDVGHRFLSWVIVSGEQWSHRLCGASLDGVSTISRALGRELCGRACLELPIGRRDKVVSHIAASTSMDDYSPKIREMAATVTRACVGTAVSRMVDTLPNAAEITWVLITGGGAHYYEDELRRAFPQACNATCANPTLANSVGLRWLASTAGNR